MADQGGKRKKMPKRPMYGLLEKGETYPDQSPKEKKTVKTKPKAKVKPVSIGKKVTGDIKVAKETRQERLKKLLKSMD